MALTYKALVAALLMAPAAADITLVAFDGSEGAISDFTELNDPVSLSWTHRRGRDTSPPSPMPPQNRRTVP